MSAMRLLLAVLVSSHAVQAVEQRESSAMNPIRKVVTMLQAMQTKVTEEGEKEAELYKKFMCYCKTSGGALSDGIAAGETKSTELGSQIKAAEEELVGVKETLASAQTDRKAAEEAIAEATAIREKEAAAFAALKAFYESSIDAISKAIKALEKGMAGAFLQTGTAQVLRKLALSKHDMLDVDRQDLLSFLSGTQGSEYAPQSGEITGILKQMGDEMAKVLKDATADEDAAIASYEELMAAKKKEIAALTAAIEAKLEKSGELAVSIAQMKNDLTDTEEALIADKDFLATLEKGCGTKTAEWEVIQKTRSEELLALAETIKVLNDDDALDLFKKTLPSAAASLLQLGEGASTMRARALAALKQALRSGRPDHAQIDLIGLALRGKKIGFEKVIAMIDTMIATLKTEQSDDDKKKEYCATQIDSSDDKKKALERSVSDSEAAIASAEEGIATLKEEIAALKAGIAALDKSVAEATEQRKDENAAFKELMASDSAAKELLGFAKNRLNKFYNPKLYKDASPPPALLAQVSAHMQDRVAPPPPPETFGAYKKKSEENTGVIAMINLLITDLDKEMAASTAEEKDAQADYELLMQDSAAKRVSDSKLITEKTATKAELEGDLEAHTDAKTSFSKELSMTMEYIASLHAECDWLLQYFEVRKEARADEIDALGKATAVLSGADYSLLQTRVRGFLRRSA